MPILKIISMIRLLILGDTCLYADNPAYPMFLLTNNMNLLLSILTERTPLKLNYFTRPTQRNVKNRLQSRSWENILLLFDRCQWSSIEEKSNSCQYWSESALKFFGKKLMIFLYLSLRAVGHTQDNFGIGRKASGELFPMIPIIFNNISTSHA